MRDVVTRVSRVELAATVSSLDLFAPTIRNHDCVFFVVRTQVGTGHFLATVSDPVEPGSDPI